MPRHVNRPDDPWVLFAWSYYGEFKEELVGAVKRVIRSPQWRAAVSIDEAMGEVADRLPDIMRCYDAKKGSLLNHVTTNVRMYVHKYCRAVTQGPRAVRQGKLKISPLPDALGELVADSTSKDRVREILEHPDMPPLYAWLLEARWVEGLTVEEIASVLGRGKGAVRRWLEEALDAARCVADR